MKYYLVKMLTNTEGQDAPSIDVYPTLENALVAWHNILAAFHNAPDVLHAVVEIIDYNGSIVKVETVEHIPEPEPEPEVEQNVIPEDEEPVSEE